MTGAMALTMLGGHRFRRWIGWVGVASAGLNLAGRLSLLDFYGPIGNIGNISQVGFVLFLVWGGGRRRVIAPATTGSTSADPDQPCESFVDVKPKRRASRVVPNARRITKSHTAAAATTLGDCCPFLTGRWVLTKTVTVATSRQPETCPRS